MKARPAWNTVHTPLDFLLSAGLIGLPMSAAMKNPAAALVVLGNHFGLHLQAMPLVSATWPEAVVAVLWIANHLARLVRLRESKNFEMHASYNHMRGEALWWRVALSMMAAVATALFLAAPLPALALVTSVAAVAIGRYLFFVSVVPLSMGLTFLKPNAAHGAHA